MKKTIFFALALLICASVAMAQNPQYASPVGGVTGGIQAIDKLGAHQNGGRGCVGCHTPHSGARGNGGSLTLTSTYDGITKTWSNQTVLADGEDSGDEALWGQDIGPIATLTLTTAGGTVSDLTGTLSDRMKTGVVFCLSCHDGNVAKGAMMVNQSFEQTAGLLPQAYGSQPIPTLLGDDGGTAGNYTNDHPIGPTANIGTFGSSGIGQFLAVQTTSTGSKRLIAGATFGSSPYSLFRDNYGLPTVIGARTGAGFAVETDVVNDAYVVCTTCHTPHSMYTASASNTSTSLPDGNPIATLTSGTFPSYFFIAAPYNPGANTANGTKASSATQFCRQCHYRGAGGSNEASGISIPTAF